MSMVRLQKLMVAALRMHLAGGATEMPAGGDLLWRWFLDLGAARSWHAAGPNPIAWSDVAAYCSLTGTRMELRHLDTLRAMDAAYIEHFHTRDAPPQEGVKPMPPVSARPMTGELFDALFGG
jgi:hypothetical protein